MRQSASSKRNSSSKSRSLVVTPSSDLLLWRPRVILATSVDSLDAAAVPVTAGEPPARPNAVMAQVDATRSLLRSIADAGAVLSAREETARARAREAQSERARVAAAMETYRLAAEVDEVLVGTLHQVTALMEERGLR